MNHVIARNDVLALVHSDELWVPSLISSTNHE